MNQERREARKKVLFLITKSTFGGAQRYVFDLATNAVAAGYEPVVALGSGTSKGPGLLHEKLTQANIRAIFMPNLTRDVGGSDIAAYRSIAATIRKERPCILHLNSSKAAGLGALAARMNSSARIIFTVHGWPFNEHRNSLWKLFAYLSSWVTALLSHEVIVVSKSDAVQAARMPGISRKVHYIPVGIEAREYLSKEAALQKMAPFVKHIGGPRIVTIAELTANKGIKYGLEALHILKEKGFPATYVVISDGEERAFLEALAKEYEVDDRVTFTGFIADAASCLKAFNIFLLPSVKEGMPYVILEAAQAGLPIVATTVMNPDLPARFPHMRHVPPKNASALAQALEEISSDASASSHSSNAFPLESMLRDTFTLYR